MKHSKKKYLEDILISISEIESYIANITSYQDIEKNMMLFDALCRRFSIIGEALYQANKVDKDLQITSKEKIMGLRHIIVHDYDLVRAADLFIIIK
jgi:uncharacterized protein with HEPN domain